MHQKERSDFWAFVLVLLVFAALVYALLGLGTDAPLPFIDR